MGRLKQILPISGKAMIYHAAAPFLAAGLKLIVVLGHKRESVRAALGDLPCEYVVNPHPEHGMFSSVQRGCCEVGEHEGCLLTTCDCPGIRVDTITAVRERLSKGDSRVIIPSFNRRRGHPAGLPVSLVKEILQLPRDFPGLNSLWREHHDMIEHLEVDDPAVLRDLDRPEDIQRLLSSNASITM